MRGRYREERETEDTDESAPIPSLQADKRSGSKKMVRIDSPPERLEVNSLSFILLPLHC